MEVGTSEKVSSRVGGSKRFRQGWMCETGLSSMDGNARTNDRTDTFLTPTPGDLTKAIVLLHLQRPTQTVSSVKKMPMLRSILASPTPKVARVTK